MMKNIFSENWSDVFSHKQTNKQSPSPISSLQQPKPKGG